MPSNPEPANERQLDLANSAVCVGVSCFRFQEWRQALRYRFGNSSWRQGVASSGPSQV